MKRHDEGTDELILARRKARGLFLAVGLFSLFVNLLMFTGPLFMLQVYDRVLASRSVETLVSLAILAAGLYAAMFLLDFTRARVMARAGAAFQRDLTDRVFRAMLARSARGDHRGEPMQDLEAIRRLLGAPVFLALFDLPWVPLFFGGIALFHPLLGLAGVCGGLLLIAVAVANQLGSSRAQAAAVQSSDTATRTAAVLRSEAGMVRSLGLTEAVQERWGRLQQASLDNGLRSSDISAFWTGLSKMLRMMLQSGMLALAALLVMRGEVTSGVMLASSVLLGRALAPIEMLIGQWGMVQRGRRGWSGLAELLRSQPEAEYRIALPRPRASVDVDGLTITVPGQQAPLLREVSFRIGRGQAMGVIGPSGAGKTTLAQALTGAMPPVAGTVRLGGAALEQYRPEVLGRHIGYLPQRVQLFEGTIARMAETPDDQEVIRAAQKAGAHEMILSLADGYNTRVGNGQIRLSGGQLQRIGLARALYGGPVLVILDEPNSNLDNEGTQALNRTIRELKEDGHCVVIVAHRPAVIHECDLLLVLEGGQARAFGPADEVMRRTVANVDEVTRARGIAGGIR